MLLTRILSIPTRMNWNELEARIQEHINTNHTSRPLPIHLINIDAKFKSGDKTDVVKMCTVVVGNRDVSAVVKTLTRVPFEPLELIPFSWRRKHPDVYVLDLSIKH